jgi:hypothetical protein
MGAMGTMSKIKWLYRGDHFRMNDDDGYYEDGVYVAWYNNEYENNKEELYQIIKEAKECIAIIEGLENE